MSAQRRLQMLMGNLKPLEKKTSTPTLPSNEVNSTTPHQFQQDFEARHSQRGVLSYGLEDVEKDGVKHGRQELRRTWQPPIHEPERTTHPLSKSIDKPIDTKGLTTVDRYNNLSWREFPKRHSESFGPFGEHGSKLSNEELQAKLTDFRKSETSLAGLSKTEIQQVEGFQHGLFAHPRYSPFRTRSQNVHELMKKEMLQDPVKAQFRSQTIRACKFGIEYGQLEGRQVMFELGGMHTPDAANKAQVGRQASAGGQLRSITNAELRKAFRHDVSDESLQFYRDGKKVDAPWGQRGPEAEHWGAYLKQRMEKHQKLGFKPDLMSYLKASAGSGLRAGFRELNAQINAFKKPLSKLAQQKSSMSTLPRPMITSKL